MSKPLFSKRHYEAIANAMRDACPKPTGYKLGAQGFTVGHDGVAKHIQWQDDVEQLASLFLSDNPRFDEARFLKACGCE